MFSNYLHYFSAIFFAYIYFTIFETLQSRWNVGKVWIKFKPEKKKNDCLEFAMLCFSFNTFYSNNNVLMFSPVCEEASKFCWLKLWTITVINWIRNVFTIHSVFKQITNIVLTFLQDLLHTLIVKYIYSWLYIIIV